MEERIGGIVVHVMGELREAAARAGYIIRRDAELPESEVIVADGLPPQIQIADKELEGFCERGRAYAEDAIIGRAMLKAARARLGAEGVARLLADIVRDRVAYQFVPPLVLSVGLSCIIGQWLN